MISYQRGMCGQVSDSDRPLLEAEGTSRLRPKGVYCPRLLVVPFSLGAGLAGPNTPVQLPPTN